MTMRRIAFAAALVAAISTTVAAPASGHYTKITDVRVAMSDGVVLTADVYVPTAADADGDGLYPCVVELTPYRKEARYSEGASYLPGKGIALIEVDARGTGGSEGEYDIVFSVREQADAAEWVEWAATRATKPDDTLLCEDEVGMYGGSYSGIIQYLVASLPDTAQGDVPARPRHLAAIAPQRAYGDLYRDIVYHGGQVIGSFGTIWSSGTSAYYLQPPTDVDTDAGRAAWLDHLSQNDPMILPYLSSPYADDTYTSDDTVPAYTQRLYEDSSILGRIENLRVPTLHLAGWFDSFTRGQLLTFQRALEHERAAADGRGPNHLIVGAWNHSGTHFISPDQGFRSDLSDWYLWWLEGREAGSPEPAWIGGGPRVRYFDMRSGRIVPSEAGRLPADGVWRSANDWPLPGTDMQRLYLAEGGALTPEAPAAVDASDAFATNPAAGNAEILSRWDNAAGTPHPQHDQRLEGPGKGLTYQTAPLASDLRVAGPIAMRLFASTVGAPGDPGLGATWPGIAQLTPPYLDTDFVVKVSEVNGATGAATLVTQGYLRASHRAYDPSRSVVIGGEVVSPFHLHTRDALDPPAVGEVRENWIEIWPTAKTFSAGNRIRIDITSADTPNHLNLLRPAVNSVWRSAGSASYIALPVVG